MIFYLRSLRKNGESVNLNTTSQDWRKENQFEAFYRRRQGYFRYM